MTTNADLSVVMPTYKHAQYLPRALGALLTQSVRPAEIIVVDDASPDDTAAILEGFARNDPIVKVIRNERNRGVTESLALGLARAGGKYLFCTASDDYVLPGFVEKTMGALVCHPQAGLCSSYFSIVDGVTGEIRPNPSGYCSAPRYFTPGEVERLVGHGSIPGHTAVLKRSALDAAGGFLADLAWHCDWFLNFVVAFREGMCHVPETLSLLTEMPGSFSNQGSRTERQFAVLGALFDRLASPEYADVAPSFQRSGALCTLGLPVLQVAALRADVWSKNTLGLVNSFTTEEYEALLDDPRPAVRKLGGFFLGTFWLENKQRRQRESDECRRLQEALDVKEPLLARRELELAASQRLLCEAQERLAETQRAWDEAHRVLALRDEQLGHLEVAVGQLSQTIQRMESSYFWKCRSLLARCKRAVIKPPGRGVARA